MSVIAKGMKMPTSCGGCKLRMAVGCCGNLPHNTRVPTCPVIELPTHGRLFDADVLMAELKKRYEEAGKRLREAKDHETAVRADAVLSFMCEMKLMLDNAPTIIEAEVET